METWGPIQRARAGCIQAAGMGLFAGALETVAIAASEKLSLGLLGFAALGGIAVLAMGGVGALLGLLTAPVHILLHSRRTSTALAIHLMAVGFLLCGWYFWQGAVAVYTDERAPGAIALAAMPVGFAGVIYFNAKFLNRRVEIGKPMGPAWLPTALGGSIAVVLLTAVFFALRDTGGSYALQDDRNVLLITADGWDHRELGPEVSAFAKTATHFKNAVTPLPATRSTAATLLTGLHPLRHKVIFDDRPLSSSYQSMAEVAAAQGYATGAFVSTWDVNADSGLKQGFRVYDDDFSPLLPGMLRVNVLKLLAARFHLDRTAADTAARFEGWMADKSGYPFVAWVHLATPDDAAIGRIVATLETHGVADETLVFIVGTHGTAASHGMAGQDGLYDDVIRVPLLVRVPDVERQIEVVPQQVRLIDVPGTAMTWLGLEPFETEGIGLVGYVTGERTATIWCALIGRRPDGGLLLGMRNNGIKYIKHHGGDAEQLFHVETDPDEETDLKTVQPEMLEQARSLLSAESIRLDELTR